MTNSRKAKFRRWARKGVPGRAPLSEKRAFGAFLTNRTRRERKLAGLKGSGKAAPYSTLVSEGEETEHELDEPLDRWASAAWLKRIARELNRFRRQHKGEVAFARFRMLLSREITYATVEFSEREGDLTEKWVSTRGSWDLETAIEAMKELGARMTQEVVGYGRGAGRIIGAVFFTMNDK